MSPKFFLAEGKGLIVLRFRASPQFFELPVRLQLTEPPVPCGTSDFEKLNACELPNAKLYHATLGIVVMNLSFI